MSYCAIIPFNDGKPCGDVKFPNAWGGAARIWDSLYRRYVANPLDPYDEILWALAKNENLLLAERAVHVATFDRAIIRREHFKQYREHLDRFIELHPAKAGHIDHLPAWASYMGACVAEAIGFHGTSVANNLWQEYDEETDEFTPYDLNDPKNEGRHIEVYDWLENLKEPEMPDQQRLITWTELCRLCQFHCELPLTVHQAEWGMTEGGSHIPNEDVVCTNTIGKPKPVGPDMCPAWPRFKTPVEAGWTRRQT